MNLHSEVFRTRRAPVPGAGAFSRREGRLSDCSAGFPELRRVMLLLPTLNDATPSQYHMIDIPSPHIPADVDA